jgi:Mpv17 / PMP22 family
MYTMNRCLILNRLLLLVALVAKNPASSFLPSRQRTFGSRGVVVARKQQQPFPTAEMRPIIPIQRARQSHPPSSSSSSSSSSSRLQIGLFPHDLFLSQSDTLMLAQRHAQDEIAQTSSNLLSAYSHLLQVHPISTKAITAAILACTGDAIAQWRSESSSYDPRRGAGFLLFGALYTGAFQHFWFQYMSQNIAHWGDMLGVWGPERVAYPVGDNIFDVAAWWKYFDIVSHLQQPPTPEALAAGKVVLNQFVVIPTIYMPLFFAFTGLVSGLDSKESMARARSLYFPLLQRNWFYWLPMQFLQFLVIPVDFQIPFVSAASLVWTIILSSIGSGTAAPSAASSIVVYDTLQTQDEFGEQEIVTVAKVEPGAANKITDDVLLEDVEKALFPELLREVVSDSRTQLATGGLATGLLAAAADEGAIGTAVGGAMAGAQLGGGDGGAASVGVAVVAVVGASLGLLAASSSNKHNHAHVIDTDATTTFELELQENDIDAVLSLNNSSMLDEIEASIMLDRNDVAKPHSALDEAVLEAEQQDVAGAPRR